jgi:hypothetical protein
MESLGTNITYDKMEDFISLTNYHNNLRILQQETYLECIQAYIELLALSGRLSEAPYVNYISNEILSFSF